MDDGGYVLPLGPGHVRLVPAGAGPIARVEGRLTAAAPSWSGPSIGGTLAGESAFLCRLREDDLAAGLLTAALAHHDWIHLESDEVSVADPLAGAAVVATLAGRTGFPRWTRSQTRCLLDEATASVLERVGWRRLTGARLPTHPD